MQTPQCTPFSRYAPAEAPRRWFPFLTFFLGHFVGNLAGNLRDSSGPTKYEPTGPAEVQRDPVSGLNFGRWISRGWIFQGASWKNQNQKFDPRINNVQTRCIVEGEAQNHPLFWRFSGGFCFSQDRLFSRNSTRKPLNLIESPIFTNAPCKTACLYNAPSMHTLERNRFQNSGVQTLFPRIRPQIRVPEEQNPLCRLLSLTK